MAIDAPLVRVRSATFGYGQREVLKGLDLDVYPGEVLSILGPNGCGKTTLLRCIGGASIVASGSITLGDVDIGSMPPPARARKIGFLFQDHAAAFPYAVRDVVTMGRAPHLGLFGSPGRADFAIADEALERVGMAHLKNRPYTHVSGGERQLALLARTLAQRPELILLDEPTAHLDFRNQVLALRIIRSLASAGMTMVMTTHDPNHALWFGGRAALMKDGRFVAVGPVADVITDATLSTTYDTDVRVFAVPGRDGSSAFSICSAWHS
jgi:iron complex transport system ATP-binding protein